MTKSQISLLGSLLAAGALAVAGCGSSSPSGGTGGKADGGGTGGKGGSGAGGHLADAGTGGAGTGGHAADAGTGGTGTDGGGDVHADTGTTGDTHADTGGDTGPTDVGPCSTSYGMGSLLLFAFANGSNPGWSGAVDTDPANSGLTTSVGASLTDGKMCPGALSLYVPFTSYGPGGAAGSEQAAVNHFYGTAQDWTGYSKLHAWLKVTTTSYAALSGIQPYVQSGGYANYTSAFTGAATFSDGGWHEIVITLNAPTITQINNVGFQIQLQATAPTAGPAVPPAVTLLVDDIWLEQAPPPAPDAGSDTPAVDTGVDAPAVDAPAVDTGTDVPPIGSDASDATSG